MKSGIKIIGVFVIIAILLIASAVAIVFYLPEEEDMEIEDELVNTVDDRIGPNENQALMIKILRIRNRGLMDKMLSYGNSWKEVPSFYYTIQVDNEFGDPKGNIGETGTYTSYDTMGYESCISFDVEEELKSSDVTIKIVEEQTSGLLGRQVEDVEVEKISLKYDYRTGMWTGDDYFRDKDGMRHYLGDDYEIWFDLYQADYDHDGIPYWIEKNVLGTNPTVDDSELDPDGDGIPTDWEWKFGYDPFVYNNHKELDPDQDGIQNDEEYFMQEYFANPFQPEIYIEADGMQPKGLFDLIPHIFYKESQQMIIERFAQHGIWTYIDDGWPDGPVNGGGEMVPYVGNMDDVIGKQMLAYYNHNFADERKGIFRHLVVTDYDGGFICPVDYTQFDSINVGNGFSSSLVRLAFTPRMLRVMLARAILHELGHSLGLVPITFPGNDIMARNIGDRYPSMSDEEYEGYVEYYYSLMNYQYIYNKPYFYSDETHTYLFDFSDGSKHEKYDQNDWEHIYIPTFQIDVISYEEPSDMSFEDFEIHNYYQGVAAEGWELDENLTEMYSPELQELSLQNNIDADIQVFVKTEPEEDGYNVRIYAKPNVEPVFAVYSLVAEGDLDSDDNVEFYSLEDSIKLTKSLIK